MNYRLRNLVLAVALALLAAVMTAMYVTSYERRVDSRQERVEVFIASKDVAPGTTGSEVQAALTKREIPRKSVAPTALAAPAQLNGQVATQWTYAGEQVTLRRFASPSAAGLRGDLKGNMRAFQLAGDANQLLSGTLQAGDRIDVVANLKASSESEVYVARVVLRDLRVLKADNAGFDSKVSDAGSSGASSVVLEATDTQVQKLLFVTSKHIWALQLRPVSDAADSPESLTTLPNVLKDGLRGRTR